jgi:hypothetical protein
LLVVEVRVTAVVLALLKAVAVVLAVFALALLAKVLAEDLLLKCYLLLRG